MVTFWFVFSAVVLLLVAVAVTFRAGRALFRQLEEIDGASCEWPLLFRRTLPSHQWW